MTWTLTGRWVFPVDQPPLDRGLVTIDGDRIVAVEPAGRRTADLDLGNVAVIPGLVNAHIHLDLSGASGVVPPSAATSFPDWLRGVIAFRRSRTVDQTTKDIANGLAECLTAGTTLIGDIAADGQTWSALGTAPLRAVVFRELIGLPIDRAEAAIDAAIAWQEGLTNLENTRPGVSPHAPYSAGRPLYDFAGTSRLPVATHLAETLAERELLEARSGPFVPFLDRVGVYAPDQLVIDWAEAVRRLSDGPTILAHANYLPADFPLSPDASIAFCPRTHAAFGHARHPVCEFLARGVRVCLGTDSLASNPDLDLLAEARFLRHQYPEIPSATILRMATLSGAEALGWSDLTGSLTPGKSADLVAVPLPNREAADPHDLLFANDAPPGGRRTLFRGNWR